MLGIDTYRRNNNAKSVLLLLMFPGLLLLLFAILAGVTGYFSASSDGLVHTAAGAQTPLEFAVTTITQYWPLVVGAAAIWIAIGYFFHGFMLRAATGARPVARAEQPRLYNLLENLCISRGMKMPNLYLIESGQLNAFASGINEKTYSITVTRGIVDILDEAELEAVLGHELSHIRHRDVRLLVITVVFVGMLSFLAQMAWRSMRFGSVRTPNNQRRNSGVLMIVAGVVLMIGYGLALLLRLALSRRREFMADAGSVELTKNPDAMIRALEKISGHSAMPGVPPDVRQMFIDNPIAGLFATHPPIPARIAALQALGGQVVNRGESRIPETQ